MCSKTVARAGRPVCWAILRSETSELYTRMLKLVKQAVEERVSNGAVWQPSCCLVDNSNAEISAVRYQPHPPVLLCIA